MKNYEKRPLFSRNLIRLRKERKLTQGELAKLTGISTRMIAYYETEAVKPPIDKVGIIAKALHVSINDLLGINDEPTPKQMELIDIDGRTMKKLKMILALPKHQRHIIYSMAESFLKQNLEK
ncbi:MAG TPA: helix-turn-helix domain-containing protein [Spirochaetota bacterium]|nr:helix-turn-helix domain-containing protein [Spirochaetota bacterium]